MSMIFYRALFVTAIFNQCFGASCLIEKRVSLAIAVSAAKIQVAGLEQESKKQLDKNKDLLT
ncbi:hypothetical protein [Mesorhizobium dulcispinae]|uniref:hypothetical protein n=1 Tax=Mesorhizobium dulcispinae TaxID=3072316 RepID=UPI002A242296|nr:hypothetical protein [Mesorhizobium sp. VK23D]MDX8518172.1 hypothetical protein [Mesorhizobium sp. VK23D]